MGGFCHGVLLRHREVPQSQRRIVSSWGRLPTEVLNFSGCFLKGGSISNVEIPRPYWFLLCQVAPLIKLSKNIQKKSKKGEAFFLTFSRLYLCPLQ
jgi:hypothetical protein